MHSMSLVGPVWPQLVHFCRFTDARHATRHSEFMVKTVHSCIRLSPGGSAEAEQLTSIISCFELPDSQCNHHQLNLNPACLGMKEGCHSCSCHGR